MEIRPNLADYKVPDQREAIKEVMMDLDVSKHINIFSRDVVKILTDLKQMVNLVGGENLHVRKKEMQSIRSALSKAKLLDENTRIMFCGKKLLVYSN